VIDERHVHELAARRGDPLVTSLYLDVDGRRYPRSTDYESQFSALCRAAGRRAAAYGEEAAVAVDADLDVMRRWLAGGIDRTTTRGVALFSGAKQVWFEPLLLPVSVHNQISVEPEADVAQLLGVLEQRQRSLVVLADRRQGRVIRIELGAVEERPGVRDEPERQADTDVELGSWERRRDEEVRRHFRRVAAAVLEEMRGWDADCVILAGSADDTAALRSCLDHAVTERVIGNLSLPISTPASRVGVAALDITRDWEERRELRLVEELHERAPAGRKAVLGLPAVMAALAQGRVRTLVVARGFDRVGARCPACGHVGVAACQCPECGTPSIEADDIVEVAISQALAQDATVEFCDGTDLGAFGGIGALERY